MYRQLARICGIVTEGKARNRRAYESDQQDSILYDTGRAVFDLDLLRRVARVQAQRSVNKRPTGSVRRVYPYGLLHLVYCAHYEHIALTEDNPRRRSRLGGTNTDRPRYRHAEGIRCGCKKRSIDARQLEDDFLRLVQLLTLKLEAHQLMLDLALRANSGDTTDTEDLEREKRAAIAVLKQQLANLLDLYKNAVIPAEKYYRDKEDRERQIAFWEARTTDIEKKAVELERVMAAFSQVAQLWTSGDSDERTALARGLFQYLVFDLDKQQIVDFRLHPWADQYLMLRAELYDDGEALEADDDSDDNSEGNENRFITLSSDEATVSPNGIQTHRILIA